MHPVLFKVFSFPIHSYGFMLALSFLLGIWLSSYKAKKEGLNPETIADMGFWIILSAIVGSRLYYVFLHFEEFKGNLTSIFNPFQDGFIGIGGLVMYGGFIGAIVAGILYFKIKKIPFLPYADISAPSVGIGIFLTRIGCFLNGCCYGASNTGSLGVSFPLESPAGVYQHHIHASGLHASQLYESAGGLLIAIILLLLSRKKLFTGFQFYLLGLFYSVLRFVVDFSRFYGTDERLGPLSHNQVVCIVLFILFSSLILKNYLFRDEPEVKTADAVGTVQENYETEEKLPETVSK
ncbi:MAG TPA: prolipoprotein diacylglyceryl transferase [Chitinispirillaceae bacterium]|nr:prolipoprotein diacylglyceryl transferase [Chitinispirillaceae bacterium]